MLRPFNIGYTSVVGPVVEWDGANHIEIVDWLNAQVRALTPDYGFIYKAESVGPDSMQLVIYEADGVTRRTSRTVRLGFWVCPAYGTDHSYVFVLDPDGGYYKLHWPAQPSSDLAAPLNR